MMIPILPQLERRQQWIDFFQRERPYAQIREPNCRVDLQTTFLQITRLGEQPLRFTLGSKTTLEPVWQIISRCNWSLQTILDGLDGVESSTAVRDRQIAQWSPDLSVRRSIPRDQHLYAEAPLGTWPKPNLSKEIEQIDAVRSLIAWGKFNDWKSALTPTQWLLASTEYALDWEISKTSDGRYEVLHPKVPTARFDPTR